MGESSARDQYYEREPLAFRKTRKDRFRFMQLHDPKHRPMNRSTQLDFTRRQFWLLSWRLAATHARVELPQHNAWPSLVSRRPPSPEECTLCVRRMLCASRPFERPIVPINTAVDPHELRFPRQMRRTRPALACSASNLSRIMLTRVDALWLECQWCRQRSHQDAAARCCAGPCPCNPDACSSRDLEERGCVFA